MFLALFDKAFRSIRDRVKEAHTSYRLASMMETAPVYSVMIKQHPERPVDHVRHMLPAHMDKHFD